MKVPRFYINELQWLNYNNASAFTGDMPSQFRTLPVSPSAFTTASFTLPYTLENPYCAVLGHSGLDSIEFEGATATGTLINESATHEGWSLMELDGNPTSITAEGNVSSILIGSAWSPPHSPDLSVKLSYDYSGIKKTTTKGGSTLTNAMYHSNPKWGNTLGAWELNRGQNHNLARSGRRIYDISFSFLSESDIFPGSLNLVTEAETNETDDTLLTGTDDFYGQVIHRTTGHLPFLFSHDKDSTALDSFSICTFDKQNFSFQQRSPGLYSTKMRLIETF